MRAKLVLGCVYSPISGSPVKPIIFRNYTCFGIPSAKKWEKQKFFAEKLPLLGVFVDYFDFFGLRSYFNEII